MGWSISSVFLGLWREDLYGGNFYEAGLKTAGRGGHESEKGVEGSIQKSPLRVSLHT